MTTDTSKRMSKDDRRKQIVKAALTVFVEKGYNGTTTSEIAKTAGISEVTLFRHFSSKQEIFHEGIEPILFSSFEESFTTSAGLSYSAKLEHLLYDRIKFISENYRIVRLILMEGPLVSEMGGGNFMEKISHVLKTMIHHVGIPITNEEITLRLLMGSILSFLYMPERDEESIKKYVSKVTSLILSEVQ